VSTASNASTSLPAISHPRLYLQPVSQKAHNFSVPVVAETLRYTWSMRKANPLATLLLLPLFISGCQRQVFADYRPLDKAGMWSGNLQEMKKLNPSDAEITQVVTLKNAGISDELCLGLVSAAHAHKHPFYSADAARRLQGANFSAEQILAFANRDQLDTISTEAVMLRLIGLSDPSVQTLLQRRMNGLPTLSSAEIGRLKNTQLSEKEIMARVENGMTDGQADAEASAREKGRAHSGTGFVRNRGRRH